MNAGLFSESVFLLAYFIPNLLLIFDTLCVCVGVVSNFTYCDEEIWHPNTFSGLWERELRLSGRQRTIVVSKNYIIVEVEEAVTPPPSLLLQDDMDMGGPHSLLAVYASAEKQIWDHERYWGRNGKKKKTTTRGEFSNYGN